MWLVRPHNHVQRSKSEAIYEDVHERSAHAGCGPVEPEQCLAIVAKHSFSNLQACDRLSTKTLQLPVRDSEILLAHMSLQQNT